MLRVLDKTDSRDQVELDVDLPVLWRLSCGGISGAIAQSGELIITFCLTVLFIIHGSCSDLPSGCHPTPDANEGCNG